MRYLFQHSAFSLVNEVSHMTARFHAQNPAWSSSLWKIQWSLSIEIAYGQCNNSGSIRQVVSIARYLPYPPLPCPCTPSSCPYMYTVYAIVSSSTCVYSIIYTWVTHSEIFILLLMAIDHRDWRSTACFSIGIHICKRVLVLHSAILQRAYICVTC